MLGKIVKGAKKGLLDSLGGKTTTANTQLGTTGGVGSVSVSDVKPFYFSFLPPKQGNPPSGTIGGALSFVSEAAGRGPAPRLAPLGGVHRWDSASGGGAHDPFIEDINGGGPTTHVNIRDNHHWTESPMSSRGEVPYLILKEYKLLSNPMLNQMINNISQTVGAVTRLGEEAANVWEKSADLLSEVMDDGNNKDMAAILEREANNILQKMTGEKEETRVYADPLAPYSLMYMLTPTQFKYTFPYMENDYRSLSNSMGGESGGKLGILEMIDDGAAILKEGADDLSFRTLREPGIMVEKPKAFEFSGREKSYTVNFPLFNTKSYAEVCKNWEFLFLLVYQNTPNRISKDLANPPCIYEAKIPGVWYSKYASITNVKVDFVGARREMPIKINFIEKNESVDLSDTSNDPPGNRIDSAGESTGTPYNAGGYTDEKGKTIPAGATEWKLTKKTLMTVIPDAYQVSITVTELFSETQNFLYHMIKESSNSKVTVNGGQS